MGRRAIEGPRLSLNWNHRCSIDKYLQSVLKDSITVFGGATNRRIAQLVVSDIGIDFVCPLRILRRFRRSARPFLHFSPLLWVCFPPCFGGCSRAFPAAASSPI